MEEEKTPKEESVKEDVKPQEAEKGNMTPDNRQQAAFLEERDKRKMAEQRAKELEEQLKRREEQAKPEPAKTQTWDGQHSEEGLALKEEITRLERELQSVQKNNEMAGVLVTYPQLKESLDDFEEYSKEYPGIPKSKVAKLFLAEKGALNTPKPEGLTPPSGGDRTPQQPGFTADDLKNLRENDPRRYAKMIQSGEIKADKLRA